MTDRQEIVVEIPRTVQEEIQPTREVDWSTLKTSDTIDRLSREQSAIDWSKAPGAQIPKYMRKYERQVGLIMALITWWWLLRGGKF